MFSSWKTLGKRLTLRSREQTPNQPRKSSPSQNKNCKPLTCKWPLQIPPVNNLPTNAPPANNPLQSITLKKPQLRRSMRASHCFRQGAISANQRTFLCWKKLTHGTVVYLRSKTTGWFECESSVVQLRCHGEEQ